MGNPKSCGAEGVGKEQSQTSSVFMLLLASTEAIPLRNNDDILDFL
jgi:hypothetical protein